jgi:hypothetical protein
MGLETVRPIVDDACHKQHQIESQHFDIFISTSTMVFISIKKKDFELRPGSSTAAGYLCNSMWMEPTPTTDCIVAD